MLRFFCFLFLASITLFANAQTEATITNGNAKIFFRSFGNGKPILIINGGPGMNSDGFISLAKSLSANNHVILYDQRGTGRSLLDETSASTITLKLMTDDIETLRKHLQIDSWVVLGHSFGGMLASYYTTLYPGNITALILSSSGGIDLELLSYVQENINHKLSNEEQALVNYWTARINDGDTSYAARIKRGTALAPAYLYNRKYVPVIAERLTQGNSKLNALIWADMRKNKFNCATKLSGFEKPVLIIQGKQDIIEEKTALKAHRVFKNSRLVLLDKCGHYGWMDAPDEYFTAIKDFLRSL